MKGGRQRVKRAVVNTVYIGITCSTMRDAPAQGLGVLCILFHFCRTVFEANGSVELVWYVAATTATLRVVD